MDSKYRNDWFRLLAKTNYNGDENACWEWQSTFFAGKGLPYAQCWFRGTTWSGHRAMMFMAHDGIPEGAHVLHKCNNSKCINPSHLSFGDPKENAKDRDDAGTTSRGEHRYNFKQTDDLKEKVKKMRLDGYGVKSIMEATGIGYQTYYRIRKSMEDFPKEHRKLRK